MATIDYATFNKVIQPIINARFPVLIRGRHGIGKSTVVYQLAKRLDLPVVERRASQMTEGDLLGLPKLSKNVTSWCPPEWLAKACNEPVVLFLMKWIVRHLKSVKASLSYAIAARLQGTPCTKILLSLLVSMVENMVLNTKSERWIPLNLTATPSLM